MATAQKSKALTTYQDFQVELAAREGEIASMLPNHVSKDRFLSSAIAAVKQTPGLLSATPRSLFASVTKSAQDGLLPDGREGVINVYKEKQKDNSWLPVAQWIPMTHGLRKRARELDDIIVDAQVVYAGDRFVRHQGDDPRIEHEPAPLGTQRGAMIGAYAIFKKDGVVLHREVMDAAEIGTVRAQSKQPDGLLWGKFTTEAWRKTVVRRGFKSVPCSEKLQTVVQRDDDLFAFDAAAGAPGSAGPAASRPKATVVQAAPTGAKRPLPPVAGKTIEHEPAPPIEDDEIDLETGEVTEPETETAADPSTDVPFEGDEAGAGEAASDADAEQESWIANYQTQMAEVFKGCADQPEVAGAWTMCKGQLEKRGVHEGHPDYGKFQQLYSQALGRVKGAGRRGR